MPSLLLLLSLASLALAADPSAPLCKHNLTAPSECASTRCDLPPTTRPQGSGWIQGDLAAEAFSGSRASLRLAANASGLPPLSVLLRRVDAGTPRQEVAAVGAFRVAGIAPLALNLTVNISRWRVGEHTVSLTPDSDSLLRGWCGEMRRFLRKAEAEAAPKPPAAARLRIDQPILFLDDYYVSARQRTARRLIPVVQERISNDSFCAAKPHPWMKIDRSPTLSCPTCSVEFGMKVNYGSAVDPLADSKSEAYDCSGAPSETQHGDGARKWTCAARPDGMALAGPGRSSAPRVNVGGAPWPPPALARWPIASTSVRDLSPADGPVDLTQISVYYTYGSDSGHAPTVIGNYSFAALSGTPIWQRLSGGVKETLVLPVDGVAGRPLLHAGTPPSQLKNPTVTCRDPKYCQCAGPNITDIGCANDNFGGSWLLPVRHASDQQSLRPLTFVYAQARRISAFAPHSVAYDNLAQERRVLVSWQTTDGLRWQQEWWEPPLESDGVRDGTLPRDATPVLEHYGAVNFCAEDNPNITARGGCRSIAKDGHSPILSWLMPFDARRQQFWLDLAFSADGVHFHRPVQEDTADPVSAVGNGEVGTWNGGILMGMEPVAGPRDQWTHALLPYADSGAHFMFGMRELSNFSVAAIEQWGAKQFFGLSIEQWPQWPTVGGVGGWAGLAAVGKRIRIEVGAVRWRTESWVSLRATSANATVQTIPVALGSGSGCSDGALLGASVNYRGPRAQVELADANGRLIGGFSGAASAIVSGDDVAAPLIFGPTGAHRSLPAAVDGPGISFRVTMGSGSELFGLSLRCVKPATRLKGDDGDTAVSCASPLAGDAVQLRRCSELATTTRLQRRAAHWRADGTLELETVRGEPTLCVEAAASTCATEYDCQLNGRCLNGRCDCYAAWQGEHCETLALEGDGTYAYGGPNSTITSWGGGPPAFDPVTGNYTLFVTEIAGHCGLSEWGSQSTIVAATAKTPAGPFDRKRLAVGKQAHNPYYAFDPNTKQHVIFHIGDGVGPGTTRQCINGTTPNTSYYHALSDRRWQNAEAAGCPCACSPCGSWVHHSASLDGPFERLAVPFNTRNRTTEGSGFVMDNPAPYIFDNGTTLVLFRKLNWCAMVNPPTCTTPRALTEIWLARAPSFRGPYEVVGDGPVTRATREEDPGIWRDQNGNFHAIFHGPGHAWSRDGLTWSLATDVAVPNSTKCHTEGDASGCGGPFHGSIRHADGTVQALSDEERPKVWVNSSTGLPQLLFFSTGQDHGGSLKPTAMDGHTRGVTVVQKIRTTKPKPRAAAARLARCEDAAAWSEETDKEEGLCVAGCGEVNIKGKHPHAELTGKPRLPEPSRRVCTGWRHTLGQVLHGNDTGALALPQNVSTAEGVARCIKACCLASDCFAWVTGPDDGNGPNAGKPWCWLKSEAAVHSKRWALNSSLAAYGITPL